MNISNSFSLYPVMFSGQHLHPAPTGIHTSKSIAIPFTFLFLESWLCLHGSDWRLFQAVNASIKLRQIKRMNTYTSVKYPKSFEEVSTITPLHCFVQRQIDGLSRLAKHKRRSDLWCRSNHESAWMCTWLGSSIGWSIFFHVGSFGDCRCKCSPISQSGSWLEKKRTWDTDGQNGQSKSTISPKTRPTHFPAPVCL